MAQTKRTYIALIDGGEGGETTFTADSVIEALASAVAWAREGDWPDEGCDVDVSVEAHRYALYTGKDEPLNGTQYESIETMMAAVLAIWPDAQIDEETEEFDTCPTSETEGQTLSYSAVEDETDSETIHIQSAAEKQDEVLDQDGEVLGEEQGEFATRQVIRIADDYFFRHQNGGSRGAWDPRQNPSIFSTESITRQDARRRLLEFGLEPPAVAKATRR